MLRQSPRTPRTDFAPERVVFSLFILLKDDFKKLIVIKRTRLKGYVNEDGALSGNRLTILKLSMAVLSCCSSIAENLPFLYTSPCATVSDVKKDPLMQTLGSDKLCELACVHPLVGEHMGVFEVGWFWAGETHVQHTFMGRFGGLWRGAKGAP